MKKLLCTLMSIIMVLSLCSCGTEPDVSDLVINGVEEKDGTVQISLPRYLIPDDEISSWYDAAESLEGSIFTDLQITKDFVYGTVTKETFNKVFGVEGYTSLVSSSIKDFVSFRNITLSEDFSTASVFVDENTFYSNNELGIIKKTFNYLSERYAYVGVLNPDITIKVYAQDSNHLLYTFNYKRPSERIIEISAKELVTAYVKDEVSADEQYNGCYLNVTGEVEVVELDTNGLPGWILVKPETGESVCWVQCNLQESAYDRAAQFKEGDIITVLGKCSGQAFHIQLDDCVVY